ncbi:YggT family protein [Chitinivorax tropicus]|uniref:YggT family protein n=1 Tax=Chitinivorax tropicus TaxID=714531 RepID=A0A840MQD4_9PROT|nr:YggT family protein [Chitinivorax tropicus]MBB5017461.1 YggT family protein [Chitinivorax tropicus]
MSHMAQALRFLIENIAGFFALALLLRFYLQVVKAPFQHPLPQFLLAFTNWIVLPTRRIVKAIGGYDTATLLLAWLTLLLKNFLVINLFPISISFVMPVALMGLMLLSVVHVLQLSVYLLMGAVIVQAILSWVSPYGNPLTPILGRITDPFLRPLQKRIPPIGGVDLSPLVLLLILQVILMLAISPLESTMFALMVNQG